MKNGKKVVLALAVALIVSTSAGHAQGFRYTIKTYFNNENSNNTVNYSSNSNKYLFSRWRNIFSFKPIFNWDYNDLEDNNTDTENNEIPSTPETPVEPEEDNTPDIPEESNENDIPNSEPEAPNNTEEPETPAEPAEPAEPTDTNDNTATSIEEEVVRLVNIEREKAGLAPLSYSSELSKVAKMKSQDMADNNYFSHTSPTYGDPFTMMRNFGIQYGYAGENIAKGYRSAESVMNGWMNSSGHRENILNSNFKTIGIGYVEANGTTYWTQMFTD